MKKLAIKLIRWYQRKISPIKQHKCRHNPTCSSYAIEAYERHNFFYASFLSSKRILSCNPLFKPKYDPVPKKRFQRKLIKTHKFYSNILNEEKLIDVFIPKKGKGPYKVLYMMDGNNLFNEETAYLNQTWKLDKIVSELLNNQKIPPLIIVGIHNNENRLNEYSPFSNKTISDNNFYGDKFVKFIVDELKPHIDYYINTLKDKEHTFIAGSSLGATISLYATLKYPETFGGAGILSPSVWWNRDGLKELFNDNYDLLNKRFYVTCGTLETPDHENNLMYIKDTKYINDYLLNNKATTYHKVYEGMKHNEAFWSSQIEELLTFLLS